LAPLDKARYPDVQYWRKNEWNRRPGNTSTTVVNTQVGIKGRKRRAAGQNVNCQFVEGADGMPVDGYRITAISNRLREIWHECWLKGIAPTTWGKGSATFRDFVRMQIYDYASELRFCEDHWKLDLIATTNYPGWYRTKESGGDSDKEEGSSTVDKENRYKNNDEYMHLPQKRGATAVPQPSKKKKKLKIPVSVETATIDPAQIPTPPASASSGNCSVANTPFASSFDLPALSEIAIEQDTADTQMLDDLVGTPSIVPNTKGTETPANGPDHVDAPTEPDAELPVPPTTRDDEIPQPREPQVAVPAPAPQDSIVEQPQAAIPAPAPQAPVIPEQPQAAVPVPAPVPQRPVGVFNPL
jgi:hypothetical protein